MSNLVKKQLALGNKATFSGSAIAASVLVDEVLHWAYTKREYNCTHDNVMFTVETWQSRNSIDEVLMFVNPDNFKSKAALVRFYKEVKSLTIIK